MPAKKLKTPPNQQTVLQQIAALNKKIKTVFPTGEAKPIVADKEFVPKAYPNQKVQGGMGTGLPTEYSGALSPEMLELVGAYNNAPAQADMSYDEERYNETPTEYSGALATGDPSAQPVLENYSAPVLMSETEALGILQSPDATSEEVLKAQKRLSPNFKEPVLTTQPLNGMTQEEALNTFQDPDADPAKIAEAQQLFIDTKEPVGSGRGDYGMPQQPEPVLENPMPTGARLDPYMEIPTIQTAGDAAGSSSGVLDNNSEPKAGNKAVLDTTSSVDRKGSAVSANARGSAMPFGKVGRNEMLMRMGAKMMAGSVNGHGAGMDAAFTEYGNIKDANRKADTDAFNSAETTRLTEARIQAQKDKANAKKKTMGMPSAVYKQAALTAITDIKGRLAGESAFNPFDNNTGLFGYAMSHVAGTDAHDTKNAIDTIEASIGFDRLQKMRDDSPTGGALGQVSNIELALLRQSLGSLKQSSSREQFVKNLNSIETQYQKAVAAVEAQQREWYRMQGVDVPEPVTNTTNPDNGGYSIKQKK
jgi:hypothetical protein